MGNVWLASSLWIGLALLASLISIWAAISVALIEIMVGAVAGNVMCLPLTPWVNYLAGFGAILLTFLAGTEVDADVVRRNLGASLGIGFISFLAPYLGCSLAARYLVGWSWPEAQIAGIALSTTSVAVVYAVMVETGLNKTELGKVILAACFVTDLGTVLALGVVFANYSIGLLTFVAAMAVTAWLLPKFVPWFFGKVGQKVSEPQSKLILLVLFLLGAIAISVGSEAVLPAYIIGMVLAPAFQHEQELAHRMRVMAFTILTPFYFLKAGSLIEFKALLGASGLIVLFLGLKLLSKFVGILPLTRLLKIEHRQGMYTTLLMSTGLTFGSISALYGLTNNIIDQRQYTILLTAVIGSAVVPTLIAQKWFTPKIGTAKQEF